jgi:hypothetical protein
MSVGFLRTVFIISKTVEQAQPEAPSGRELSPQATEGECVMMKFI